MPFELSNISQNLVDYLPEQTCAITPTVPKKLKTHYLKHYFSPWTGSHQIIANADIKEMLLAVIQQHSVHPGYCLTRKRHDANWINEIADNADLNSFPNLLKPAIVLSNVGARLLPTDKPSFKDIDCSWHGYPFDDMQQSYLCAGTPIQALHISKDHGWLLILTAGFFGWVQSEYVAFATSEFMQSYQSEDYVIPLEDSIQCFDSISELPIRLRIGNIYPLKNSTVNEHCIYIPIVDQQRYAVLTTRHISKTQSLLFPRPITYKNIAQIANQMMGNPYGWGGICGFRDCSATLADLMGSFGIWLPRNSKDQIEMAPSINLKKMTSIEKLSIINEKGIPFLTLLYAPGHIVLYIGQKNGIVYVYHSTFRLYGTVITPIDIHLKKEQPHSLLEEIEQMRILYTPRN